MNPTNSRPTCSFCGKYHAEVRKLIAGPGVCICNECVIICGELIAKEMPGWPEFLRCPNDPLRVTHDMLTAMRDAGEISDQVFINRLAEATVREFTVSKSVTPNETSKKAPSRRRSK